MSNVQNRFEFEVNTPPEGVYSYLLEPREASEFVAWFGDAEDVTLVGGKNASLSSLYKMCAVRSDTTLRVPNGFCLNTNAYKHFVQRERVQEAIHTALNGCDIGNMPSLIKASETCRRIVYEATAPHLPGNGALWEEVIKAYRELSTEYCCNIGNTPLSVAVRSSATAEDLPNASFAGQHDSFLNIEGEEALIQACRCCLSSVFTPRAISYRVENKFDHFAVALSVGVMKMVRADIGVSGVLFTCETETGHADFVQVDSLYGLGETIVQGRAIPDEFMVHKPTFREGYRRVLSRTLGSKALTLGYSAEVLQTGGWASADAGSADKEQPPYDEGKSSPSNGADHENCSIESDAVPSVTAIRRCESTLTCHPTPIHKQESYSLSASEVMILVDDALEIEDRFECAMDIEFAKDGQDEAIYILQARPETVNVKRKRLRCSGQSLTYTVDSVAASHANTLSSCGMAIGDRVAVGPVRLCHDPTDASGLASCRSGDILVTNMTSPEMVPVMKACAAILTESGSRTCHAAIVAREMDIPCIVGATGILSSLASLEGAQVTVSCCEGERGRIYEGIVPFTSQPLGDVAALQRSLPTPSFVRINLGDPKQAFSAAALQTQPRAGVGLVRTEFCVANCIGIHPMALVAASRPESCATEREGGEGSLASQCELAFIRQKTRHFDSPAEYFVRALAQHVGIIAAAFYPAPVNVRFSDFKSNEYAALVGAAAHEPEAGAENNPLLGFRGAARYAHERYEEAFRLECKAIRVLREEHGLTNVEVMVPFVRSVAEARRVMAIIREECPDEALRTNMMLELPCNVVQLEDYAAIFTGGFSIGSNDLAMLNTGTDRDSALLQGLYQGVDDATKLLISDAIRRAKKVGSCIGICGEAATEVVLLKELLASGVDYISCSPASVVKTMRNIRSISI